MQRGRVQASRKPPSRLTVSRATNRAHRVSLFVLKLHHVWLIVVLAMSMRGLLHRFGPLDADGAGMHEVGDKSESS